VGCDELGDVDFVVVVFFFAGPADQRLSRLPLS
jgi:hypothetical protein